METNSPDDARRSLDSIGASRHQIADRLTTPVWYYPVLGILVAQMVVVFELYGPLAAALSAAVMAIGAGMLVGVYAAQTGVVATFPTTLRGGLLLALFALGMLVPLGVVVFDKNLSTSIVAVLALASFVSTVVFGTAYDAAYRAGLRRGDAGA